jgi:hypothetical protein
MTNKSNTPKRKRLNRQARLQSGRKWLIEYKGKHIRKGYSNWFGVSEVCAILELRLLGVEINDNLMDEAKSREISKGLNKSEKKLDEDCLELNDCSSDGFDYIAGHTSNGVPYGINLMEESQDEYFYERPCKKT